MKVTVHLAPDLAEELHRGAAETQPGKDLLSAASELGVQLRPMHPSATDPALRSTFVAEASDFMHAQQVVSRFQGMAGTQSAYVKPAPEMP